MIKSIKVPEKSNLRNILLFTEVNILESPTPNIIPLFGPNGAGKSTFIKAIKDKGIELESDDCNHLIFGYANSTDNFKVRRSRSIDDIPYYLKEKFDAYSLSEGQSILHSAMDLIEYLKPSKGDEMFSCDGGQLIILLDELDSGLSIDNIDTVMRKIKNVLRKRDDIQIFMSFNNPRVLKHFHYVLSMYDGKFIEMHTDEDMMKEIRKHKREFDKLRKYSNGMPKLPYE